MAVRSFRDSDGREWSVWSVVPSRKSDLFLPDSMADGWLCFECGSEKRRLHPVADEWELLSEEQLVALCLTAAPVKPRQPRPASPRPEAPLDASAGPAGAE